MTTYNHFVQYTQNTKGSNGVTLFNHITNLIQASVDPKNTVKGVEKIEILSNYLKNHQFKYQEPEHDYKIKAKKIPEGLHKNYRQLANNLIQTGNNTKVESTVISNPLQEFQALKNAGISIGQSNYFFISKILKVIAAQFKATQLRFWGKILGFKDYYVIQGITNRNNSEQLMNDAEPAGTGVNYYTYWVTNDILSDWVELPLISPEQLRAAKKIKYVFSGNLQKTINKFPNFNGKQKHLLKAQIVRINHSCEIVPKGLYKLNEQNPTNIEFEEQFKCPQISQQIAPQNWVHLNPYILNQGRCSYYIDPSLSQQQKEALNTQNAEKDPLIQRFKSIAQDKPLEQLGYTSNWIIQQIGETQVINLIGKQEGQSTSYGVVLLKNLTWPGAYTVGYSGAWVNIYVGYGQKIIQNSFNPIQPQDLSIEGQDQTQYRQPNPSKPIVVAQVVKAEQIPE